MSQLTPFQSAVQVSGSGFDAKLNQLVGIGQAIKASQTARQQMQEQLRQQKELIQFRADTQLESQIDYYDRVTRPANEAEARAKAEQQREKARMQSLDAARERKNELIDEFNNDFGALREYNIFTPRFEIQQDEETGMYQTTVLAPTQDGNVTQLDYQSYRSMAERMNDQAKWFEDVREGLQKGWFPETYPEGQKQQTIGQEGRVVERMTRSEAETVLETARKNPELALSMRERFVEPAPFEAEDMEGSGSGGARKDTRGATSFIASVNEFANENGVVEFNYVPEPSIGKGRWWGEAPERRSTTVNFNGLQSVGQIRQTLSDTAQEVFELDLQQISRLDDQTRQQILAGDDEGLKGDEKDIARRVKTLREEGAEKEIDKLFILYYGLPSAINVWRERFGDIKIATMPDNELIPNFTSPSSEADFFRTPDVDVTANAFGLRQQFSTQ